MLDFMWVEEQCFSELFAQVLRFTDYQETIPGATLKINSKAFFLILVPWAVIEELDSVFRILTRAYLFR